MGHRNEVLRCFKHVIKAVNETFAGDKEAIDLTKRVAREEFRKRINLTDQEEIQESIQIGYDSANILKRTVIQAKLNDKTGNYEAEIKRENLDG